LLQPSLATLVTNKRCITGIRESMSTAQRKDRRIQLLLLLCLFAAFLLHWSLAKPVGAAAPTVPALGLYRCWSGGFDHLQAGTLTLLPGGRYQSYRHVSDGRYSFQPETSAVKFLDGDYRSWEYHGIYQSTHVVAAPPDVPQDNTLRSNSTQPDRTGARIVLLPDGARDEIGAERPGQYQYCYHEQ
jgi:hypothetical protein